LGIGNTGVKNMSTFKGTFWDRRAAFHVIWADYSTSQLSKIGMRDSNIFNWERARKNSDFNARCDEISFPYKNPLFAVGGDALICKTWDRDAGEYVEAEFTPARVNELLIYWEDKNKNEGNEEWDGASDELDEDIDVILSSIQKCVYLGEAYEEDFELYVYFLEKTGEQQPNLDNRRFITGPDGLVITDVPSRPTGGTYSHTDTNDGAMRGDIGQYFPQRGPSTGKDKVSGKVRLSYDKNSETWGVQNQILAQLTQELEPASIVTIDLGILKDSSTPDDFYNKNGTSYIGGFTTAEAVVLSKENNNPEAFGPNFLEPCSDQRKMEVIRVVNRTTRSYKANTVVMCHLIDNEWIATDFGSDPGDIINDAITNIGRWEFSKFVANADVHFCLSSDNAQFPVGGGVRPSRANDSSLYLSMFIRTLMSLQTNGLYSGELQSVDYANVNELFLLNLRLSPSVSSSELLTDPYAAYVSLVNVPYQVTDFDHLGPELGGVSSISYVGRTNLYVDYQGNAGAPAEYYNELNPYWGVIFPDGFKAASYVKVKGDSGTFVSATTDSQWYTGGATIGSAFENVANSFSNSPDGNDGMFVRGGADPNVKNLPASVGINGAWSETSTPTIAYGPMWTGDASRGDLRYLMENMIPNDVDGLSGFQVALFSSEGGGNAYGMIPVNAGKVCFSPLSAELAGMTDPLSDKTADSYDRDFKTQAQYIFSQFGNGQGIIDTTPAGAPNIFGNAITRAVSLGCPNSRGYIAGADTAAIYSETSIPSDTFEGIIAFDVYNNFTGGEPRNITVDPFREDDYSGLGGNMVGIIGARNVVTKTNGGVVNIDCECSYGINGDVAGGSSGSVALSIIMGVALGSSSPSRQGRKIPGWGSTDGDDLFSFGTTALHVKAYDWWPEHSTVYLPTYFLVIHFLPGGIGTKPQRVEGVTRVVSPGTDNAIANYTDIKDQLDMESEEVQQKFNDGEYLTFYYDDSSDQYTTYDKEVADVITQVVDYRIPTHGLGANEGNNVGIDEQFDGFSVWRPERMWNICTVNRGMMISPISGSWSYLRKTGQIDGTVYTVEDQGSGYLEGEILNDLRYNTYWRITSLTDGGGVAAVEPYAFRGDGSDDVPAGGKDITPDDFGADGIKLSFSKGGAKIIFAKGKVGSYLESIAGPKERVSKTRLSTSSGDGTNFVWANKTSSVSLDQNRDHYFPGKYEFFYHFHNDISHTYQLEKGSLAGVNPPNTQFITMSIN
jgi:hypothetical protein